MPQNKSSNKIAGAGLLAAVAASLCCITPILALLAGGSGIASTFSWMEPFRPFLIAITVLVIGFAWYQKMKPQTAEMDCDCEEEEKTLFMQSKTFLGIVTVFAGLMLAFPSYTDSILSVASGPQEAFQGNATHTLVIDIKGMTCGGSEGHVEAAANKLAGVRNSTASHLMEKAEIAFDPQQTTPEEITEAVKTTGYKVLSSKVVHINQK